MPKNIQEPSYQEVGTGQSDRIQRINMATELYLQKVLSSPMSEELWELIQCGAVRFEEGEGNNG